MDEDMGEEKVVGDEGEKVPKIPHARSGPNYTLWSEDGRPLCYHPDPNILRQSILYVSDDVTPIKKGNPPREKRVEPPVKKKAS